jgi:uracil phosphoribosyltransferase
MSASMNLVIKSLRKYGTPFFIHAVSVITSKEGIKNVKRKSPINTRIWVAALDDELTAQLYIVHGLGDAGDLAFGGKK